MSFICCFSTAYSQTIENVDFHVEGKTIVVTYDLSGCAAPTKPLKKSFDKPSFLDMKEVEAGNYFMEFICGDERFVIQVQKM